MIKKLLLECSEDIYKQQKLRSIKERKREDFKISLTDGGFEVLGLLSSTPKGKRKRKEGTGV